MNQRLPSFIALLFCSFAGLPAHGQSGYEVSLAEEETALVIQARKILAAYHDEKPAKGNRKLHLICWRPNDREYPADNAERLTRIMEHIQNFYADEMERMGLGRRSIQLDYDEVGKMVIHHVVGSAPFADYKKPEGQRVKADCWPVLKAAGLDPDRETVVIFTNLSNWDPEKNTFFHKSPYYASGNHRGGIAWQLASPELDTKNLKLKEPMIQDGEYGEISLGKHNSIFIGGIAHELGHGLGLPHCRERDDEKAAYGTALMGSGNRTYGDELRGEGTGSFLTLAHGLRLASHPQFSGSVKGMNLPAKATFSEMRVTPVKQHFVVTGKVTSPIPVYALIAYLDPNGGSDYDARTVCAVPTSEGDFELDCHSLVKGTKSAIRVVALLANGGKSTWSSAYELPKDGTPDISLMTVTTELTDFASALNQNQQGQAKALAEAFPKGSQSRTVAKAILAGRNPNRMALDPGELDAKLKRIPLSQMKPSEVSVGWGKPAYDFLPREEALLVAGGQLFTTGIYAHAPAKHAYTLPEGHDWKTLTGACGLPDQRGGSVAFRITADGKEVFQSPTVEPGITHTYEIDLRGVSELTLEVTNGGDGEAADWGYWFDPILSR